MRAWPGPSAGGVLAGPAQRFKVLFFFSSPGLARTLTVLARLSNLALAGVSVEIYVISVGDSVSVHCQRAHLGTM